MGGSITSEGEPRATLVSMWHILHPLHACLSDSALVTQTHRPQAWASVCYMDKVRKASSTARVPDQTCACSCMHARTCSQQQTHAYGKSIADQRLHVYASMNFSPAAWHWL